MKNYSQETNSPSLPILIAVTIRSDRFEPLQTAPELLGLKSILFDDLKPMPPNRFREIIAEPAKRASVLGNNLVIKHNLVNRLIEDSSYGGDTLPLLSLTLARLYRDYGSVGELRLEDYENMGGLKDIINKEAESVLSIDPAKRALQLEILHSAFIPWLATINIDNDQPMRRMASLEDLPIQSKSLITALAEKRLLIIDKRDNKAVVEVAHEALLRQWDVLADWLIIHREDLNDAESLDRAVRAWVKNEKKPDWLIEGERLAKLEVLMKKPGFDKLAMQPGYKSRISYTYTEYFNLSEKEKRIATARRQTAVPTLEQINHVISTMPNNSAVERRNSSLIAFTLLTGARDSAIASMKFKHIDVVGNKIFQDAREVNTKFSKTFTTDFFPVGYHIHQIVYDWVRYLKEELLWGNDDPLFPKTNVIVDEGRSFKAEGLMREHWRTTSPIRTIFKNAFEAADLPYYIPHSFRKTLVTLGQKLCKSPEEFKAWSQNLGHDEVMTTLYSYGHVEEDRQSEIFQQLKKPQKIVNQNAKDLAKEIIIELANQQAKIGA